MSKLFGTDGVRGVANAWLTPELSFYLGRAVGAHLLRRASRPRVLIGRDTRASGTMLQSALVAGCNSVGVDCEIAGVLPTPAIAYLTRAGGYDAGVVISASHNPVEDNGIKFFSADGIKLSDDDEEIVSETTLRLMKGDDALPRPTGGDVGGETLADGTLDRYVDFLASTVSVDLTGMKIVLDCGNGAAYLAAPQLFERLGAQVIALNTQPNGRNINVNCGSTAPHVIREAVIDHRADVGFSFDGDADRVMAADENGALLDGDHMIVALATYLHDRGQLTGQKVVVTPYSNGGLTKALKRHGIDVVIAPAGDKNVLEAMMREGLVLGGEQSGHIILLSHNTAGDGLLSALALLQAARSLGVSISSLGRLMETMPQLLVGVPVHKKDGWQENPAISQAIAQAAEQLGPYGRIFVRASGTENLIRILGEGEDEAAVRRAVEHVARVVEEQMG